VSKFLLDKIDDLEVSRTYLLLLKNGLVQLVQHQQRYFARVTPGVIVAKKLCSLITHMTHIRL
jgi:hypothetical protein